MHRAKNFPQVLCTRKKHLSSVNGSHNRLLLLLHLPPHLHPPLLVFLQSTKCAHPEICKISILPQGMHLKKLSKVRLSVYHVVNGQTARKRRCGKRTNEIACPAKGNCKAPDLKSRARYHSLQSVVQRHTPRAREPGQPSNYGSPLLISSDFLICPGSRCLRTTNWRTK